MTSDVSLKHYLLEKAAEGVTFKQVTDQSRIDWGLQHRTCREIRLALNSLAFNEKYEPVCVGGMQLPPLKRRVLKRDAAGCVLETDYVLRAHAAQPRAAVRQRHYFVAS